MNRRGTLAALAGLFATLPVLQRGAAAADAKTAHRLALHVDQNDAAVMSLALGNAGNVQSYFDERGEAWRSRSSPMGRGCTCCGRTARR
jgi:hypothetical protein